MPSVTTNIVTTIPSTDTIECWPVATLWAATTTAISAADALQFLANSASVSSSSSFYDSADASILGNVNIGGILNLSPPPNTPAQSLTVTTNTTNSIDGVINKSVVTNTATGNHTLYLDEQVAECSSTSYLRWGYPQIYNAASAGIRLEGYDACNTGGLNISSDIFWLRDQSGNNKQYAKAGVYGFQGYQFTYWGPQGGFAKGAISGCSVVNDATASILNFGGKFVSGTTGTCSVTITPEDTTNVTGGMVCFAQDVTTPGVLNQTNYSTTTVSFSGTTVSGDTIIYACFVLSP